MLDRECQRFGWSPIEKCTKGHVQRSERQKVAWILPYPPPLELLGAKTNHLPNIQSDPVCCPLQDVVGNKNFDSDLVDSALAKNENKFISSNRPGTGISSGSFRGLPDPLSNQMAEPREIFGDRDLRTIMNARFAELSYSAAAIDALAVVAERMKSEIRGTISDLNREPLNTP